jgi:hypothetical protein
MYKFLNDLAKLILSLLLICFLLTPFGVPTMILVWMLKGDDAFSGH